MRNGDCYKIKHMSESGVSDSDIIHYFRNSYDEDEIKRFMPKGQTQGKDAVQEDAVQEEEVVAAKPKPKRKARKKTT